MPDDHPVEISALHSGAGLAGFLLSRRWPDSTQEWGQFLLLAVRFAAVPGLLVRSTVFLVREELPDAPVPGAVGVVLAQGAVVGERAVGAGSIAASVPGLVVLHPPGERPSADDPDGELASGCVLLPGLPYLGLDHRAAWARGDRSGNVRELRTAADLDPASDVDTAVLATLLAA